MQVKLTYLLKPCEIKSENLFHITSSFLRHVVVFWEVRLITSVTEGDIWECLQQFCKVRFC